MQISNFLNRTVVPRGAWVNYGRKICHGAFNEKTRFTLPGGMRDPVYMPLGSGDLDPNINHRSSLEPSYNGKINKRGRFGVEYLCYWYTYNNRT